jgi:formyltetrahydrofolate hydrolase
MTTDFQDSVAAALREVRTRPYSSWTAACARSGRAQAIERRLLSRAVSHHLEYRVILNG